MSAPVSVTTTPRTTTGTTGGNSATTSRSPFVAGVEQLAEDGGRARPPDYERLVAPVSSADPEGTRYSSGTRPREAQSRWSAHPSIGGRTTSALRSAIATLSATIIPKSCRSGRDDNAITATPAIAVRAE